MAHRSGIRDALTLTDRNCNSNRLISDWLNFKSTFFFNIVNQLFHLPMFSVRGHLIKLLRHTLFLKADKYLFSLSFHIISRILFCGLFYFAAYFAAYREATYPVDGTHFGRPWCDGRFRSGVSCQWIYFWPQWAVFPGFNPLRRGWVYRPAPEAPLLGDADGVRSIFGNAGRVWASALHPDPP